MSKQVNGGIDRIESAANITLIISKGGEQGVKSFNGSQDGSENQPQGYMEVPISRLDTTKEVEISEIRESSLKASGYSITSISYSGTMMFKGSRITKMIPDSAQSDSDTEPGTKTLDDFLYDEHGVPVPVSINITHEKNDEDEMYQHVLVTSESYEVRSEEATETAYDWVAMDRKSDQPQG